MSESRLEFHNTIPALLVFADIIDSSRYSAILGYTEYANRLNYFQQSFTNLGARYFHMDKSSDIYCEIKARGDEGILFFAGTEVNFEESILRAIDFLYHLKAHLKFATDVNGDESGSPRQMGLGAGIHVGSVAYATKLQDNHSIIDRLEGFSINYAKRVESCSRCGKYSRIFLSKNATDLLEDAPVITYDTRAQMKGIEDNTEVFEIQSALLTGIEIKRDDHDDDLLIKKVKVMAENPSQIEEPWLKSLVVSVLDRLIRDSISTPVRCEFRKLQYNIAWHSSNEEDPILLYLRAKKYSDDKQVTQQIRYLKNILDKHPKFAHARKRMIEACWEIAKGKYEPKELVYARDMAKEYLEHFPHLLIEHEKETYKSFIKKAEKKLAK